MTGNQEQDERNRKLLVLSLVPSIESFSNRIIDSRPSSLVLTRTKSDVIFETARKAKSALTLHLALQALQTAHLSLEVTRKQLALSVGALTAAKLVISGPTRSCVQRFRTRTSKTRHLMMRHSAVRAPPLGQPGVPWPAPQQSRSALL
jgi:hypothetical protein